MRRIPLYPSSAIAALAIGLFVATALPADDEFEYEVQWVDGTREAASAPPLWIARESAPLLGERPVLDGPRPMRRWRRLGDAAQPHVAERVELIGGDRLTGRIVEHLPEVVDGVSRPACLVVEPQLAVDEPIPEEPERVRVPIERLRRVVWEESTPRPLRPGTLFYRDGRRTTFRSLRWEGRTLRLLVDEGIEEVDWDEAAEVHPLPRSQWDEYADQLAVLAPGGTSRLIRFEALGGLRATVSTERLRAVGDVSQSESQRFELLPAWSLDPLSIPQRLLASQTFFSPTEAPLSSFEPTAYVHKAVLAGGWNQWRADSNVQGNPLAAGDRVFGWGLGVQGYAALEYELPAWSRAFHTFVALDRAAGDGGCVRARIHFGPNPTASAPGNKPLYESPMLIGSSTIHDSGRLELRTSTSRPNRLVLVCDSLAKEIVAEADPLDLRDIFDWLEPTVELDATQLSNAVHRHAASLFVRQHHWVVQGAYGETWRWENRSAGGRTRLVVAPLKSPLVVSRMLVVPPECEALEVHVGTTDDRSGPATLRLTAGGQKLAEAAVAVAADAKQPPTLRLPIPENRRGRELRFELAFDAATLDVRYDFYGVGIE